MRKHKTHLLVQEEAFDVNVPKFIGFGREILILYFFNVETTSRNRVNQVNTLVDDNRVRHIEAHNLCNVTIDYFTNLLKKHNNIIYSINYVLSHCISTKDNITLIFPLSI